MWFSVQRFYWRLGNEERESFPAVNVGPRGIEQNPDPLATEEGEGFQQFSARESARKRSAGASEA